MTLKKMLLLASMALAAIAFSAPAAAQAEANWIFPTGGTVGGEESAEVLSVAGNITSDVGELKTTAFLELEAEVWNNSMGEGRVFSKTAGTGTVAGVPAFLDCTVEVTLLRNWSLTLTTDAPATTERTGLATIDLENVEFENHYNAGCQAAGLPPHASASGTVTITAENKPGADDLNLTLEGGDLTLNGTGGTVPVGLTSTPNPLTGVGVQVEQH